MRSGSGIAEILVLPTPETMPRHHDMAAEDVVLRVEAGYRLAFVRRKKPLDHGTALRIEILLTRVSNRAS